LQTAISLYTHQQIISKFSLTKIPCAKNLKIDMPKKETIEIHPIARKG
jgi:hypothetical protein